MAGNGSRNGKSKRSRSGGNGSGNGRSSSSPKNVIGDKGFLVCGAKAKGSGRPCQQPAGWGTDHSGTGRCKLHGGKSPVKHGMYATEEMKAVHALPLRKEAENLSLKDDAIDVRALRLNLIQKLRDLHEPCPECGTIRLSADEMTLIAHLAESSSRIDYRARKIAVEERSLLLADDVVRLFTRFLHALASERVLKPKSEGKVQRIVEALVMEAGIEPLPITDDAN